MIICRHKTCGDKRYSTWHDKYANVDRYVLYIQLSFYGQFLNPNECEMWNDLTQSSCTVECAGPVLFSFKTPIYIISQMPLFYHMWQILVQFSKIFTPRKCVQLPVLLFFGSNLVSKMLFLVRFFLVFSPLLFLVFNCIYWIYFYVWDIWLRSYPQDE